MGDRCNIVVKEDDIPSDYICFYSHWGGSYIKETLQNALKKAKDDNRIQDFPYLNRIIFSTLIQYDLNSTIGYGISTQILDNEYPILIVNSKNETVEIFYSNEIPSRLFTIDAFLEFDFSDEKTNEMFEYPDYHLSREIPDFIKKS